MEFFNKNFKLANSKKFQFYIKNKWIVTDSRDPINITHKWDTGKTLGKNANEIAFRIPYFIFK